VDTPPRGLAEPLEPPAALLLLLLDCVIQNEAASWAESRSAEDARPQAESGATHPGNATAGPHTIPLFFPAYVAPDPFASYSKISVL
jgi:hypothetical protein